MDLLIVEPARLAIVDEVVAELVHGGIIAPENIMLLGAECRDILHRAHGHSSALQGTEDVDIGLAINDWDVHGAALKRFTRTGDTGIRYRIAETPVDIMPFGRVEDPRGEVTPSTRINEPFSGRLRRAEVARVAGSLDSIL